MEKRVQVHIPYPVLDRRFKDVLKAGINPEVFVDGRSLDRMRSARVKEIGEGLRERGLSVTLHGPFMELSPGSPDEKIRLITMERYRQTFEVVSLLRPATVVLHAGYDDRSFDWDVDLWLDRSLRTWPEFVREAERLGTVIALENVFEEDPGPIKRLVQSLDSPNLGVCLDAGHLNLFSRVGLEEWFCELGAKIEEVHLHDNNGLRDDHLPVGEGSIDFQMFFTLLDRYSNDPVYTIEPHGEGALEKGLEAVRRFLQ